MAKFATCLPTTKAPHAGCRIVAHCAHLPNDHTRHQGEGRTKQAAEAAAAAEALAAVSQMGEVVVCGRHHVTSLWATIERLLGDDEVMTCKRWII